MSDYTMSDNRALYIAASNGHISVIDHLLKNGADINSREQFHSPLESALINQNWNTAMFLIERGADVHYHDDFALLLACMEGHLDTVKLLIKYGANIHAGDDIALHKAVYNKHLDVVKFLVENGADIHARDDDALKTASMKQDYAMVKYLIEKCQC